MCFSPEADLVAGIALLPVAALSLREVRHVREVPFAARTSTLVFDLKVVLLLAVFVFAFFRFTWSLRQYSFGALLVASALLYFGALTAAGVKLRQLLRR